MCVNPIPIVRKADEKSLPELQPSGARFYLVPCGRCWQCGKRRTNDWLVRIRAEFDRINESKGQVLFLTFTFDDEHLPTDKETLSKYVRQWKDLVRKHLGYFPRHFLCTERGTDENGTHRLHFHGFLFLRERLCSPVVRDRENPKIVKYVPRDTVLFMEKMRNMWKFGRINWIEEPYSRKSISYASKYMFKAFLQRKNGDILASKIYASLGFGDSLFYDNSPKQLYDWYGEEPFQYNGKIRYSDGFIYALPRYIMEKVKTYFGFRKISPLEETLKRCKTIEDRVFDTFEEARSARISILKGYIRDGLYVPRHDNLEYEVPDIRKVLIRVGLLDCSEAPHRPPSKLQPSLDFAI